MHDKPNDKPFLLMAAHANGVKTAIRMEKAEYAKYELPRLGELTWHAVCLDIRVSFFDFHDHTLMNKMFTDNGGPMWNEHAGLPHAA